MEKLDGTISRARVKHAEVWRVWQSKYLVFMRLSNLNHLVISHWVLHQFTSICTVNDGLI
jgi:hypothetical protein